MTKEDILKNVAVNTIDLHYMDRKKSADMFEAYWCDMISELYWVNWLKGNICIEVTH